MPLALGLGNEPIWQQTPSNVRITHYG